MKLNRDRFLIAAFALSASAGGCDLGGSTAQVTPEQRGAAPHASGATNAGPGSRETLDRPDLTGIQRTPTDDPRAGPAVQGAAPAPTAAKASANGTTSSSKSLVGSPTKEAGLPTPTKEAGLPTPTKEAGLPTPTKEAGLPTPTNEAAPPPTKKVAAPTKEL